MKKTYTIKISGSGTLKELELALLQVSDEIHLARKSDTKGLDRPTVRFEDPILMTEISEE
jgi:hypothetical protein